MKSIVEGLRNAALRWGYEMLARRIRKTTVDSGLEGTEVITSGARGPYWAGEQQVANDGIPVMTMEPSWKLGKGAGFSSNRELAQVYSALLVLRSRDSTGTQGMIAHMKALGLPTYVLVVKECALCRGFFGGIPAQG